MLNPFSAEQMALIANLLNQRGFIVDSDIPALPCRYTQFGAIVQQLEDDLRKHGYSGGSLSSWSTGFRGATPSYGCVDSDAAPDDKVIDAYCDVTGDGGVDSCIFTPKGLQKLGLGLEFACPRCGHSLKILPEHISQSAQDRPLPKLRGRCTKCGAPNLPPSGVWKRFSSD